MSIRGLIFPKGINPKLNAIAQLGFELIFYDVAIMPRGLPSDDIVNRILSKCIKLAHKEYETSGLGWWSTGNCPGD